MKKPDLNNYVKFDDNSDVLVPAPHFIKSVRHKPGNNLIDSVSEWVDNSIGHGYATGVTLMIDNGKSIGIVDNGAGIPDINSLLQYGKSTSSDDYENIGGFGIGAKDGAIYLGDSLKVETVHNGRLHAGEVNWHVVESGYYLKRYKGDGTPSTSSSYAALMVEGGVKHIQKKTADKLVDELGMRFAPAIEGGVTVKVKFTTGVGKKKTTTTQVVTPWKPDMVTSFPISGEFTPDHGKLAGKTLKWSGFAGKALDLTDSKNAVHIAFAHRVVESTKAPFGTKSAPGVYVSVTLDKTTPWKHALNNNKTAVVLYKDELVKSIAGQIAMLVEEAAKDSRVMKIKGLVEPIKNAFNKLLTDPEGTASVKQEPKEPQEPKPVCEVCGEDPCICPCKKCGQDPCICAKPKPKEPKPKPKGENNNATPEADGGIIFGYADDLEGKLFTWHIAENKFMVTLLTEQFEEVFGHPPKIQASMAELFLTAAVSHALAHQYENAGHELIGVVSDSFVDELEQMANSAFGIQPSLSLKLMKGE